MKTKTKTICTSAIAFALILCMLLASSISFTASAATTNANVSEVSKVTFQNVGTGQYLNFDYGNLRNGTSVRVWPWDGTTEQLWSIDKVNGCTYRILTYKSAKFCLDVYRGSSKLKVGQQCDIWKTAADSYAQNVTFYACDDGTFIIRMAQASDLALAATASKARVKLVKFSADSKYQKWIIKDAKGNKINIMGSSASMTTPSGITTSAYQRTGTVYTVSNIKYYQARTTKVYNGVAKNTIFYVFANGAVVNDATVLNKLCRLELFNQIRSNQREAANQWVMAAKLYYEVCFTVAVQEKAGNLIGKTAGTGLNLLAGNTFSIFDTAVDIVDDIVSPETVKTVGLIGMLHIYSNNVVACGNEVVKLMSSSITDYDKMIKAAYLYAECAANFAALKHLGGDTVNEKAKSTVTKEYLKFMFVDVLGGIADSVIPDIYDLKDIKRLADSAVSLGEFAMASGADKAYNNEWNRQTAYWNNSYSYSKTIADKLRKA